MKIPSLEPDRRPIWLRVLLTRQGMVLVAALVLVGLAWGAAAGWVDACGLRVSWTDIRAYPCGPDDWRFTFVPFLVLPVLIWSYWKRYNLMAREAAQDGNPA